MPPRDMGRAAIARRFPRAGVWRGFVSRTLIFGAVAEVLHYIACSRLISDLPTQISGIPLICFYDDFAALGHRILATHPIAFFTGICASLGMTPNRGSPTSATKSLSWSSAAGFRLGCKSQLRIPPTHPRGKLGEIGCPSPRLYRERLACAPGVGRDDWAAVISTYTAVW